MAVCAACDGQDVADSEPGNRMVATSEQGEARPEQLPDAPSAETADLHGLPKRVLQDEAHIVQFPRFLHRRDLVWEYR